MMKQLTILILVDVTYDKEQYTIDTHIKSVKLVTRVYIGSALLVIRERTKAMLTSEVDAYLFA